MAAAAAEPGAAAIPTTTTAATDDEGPPEQGTAGQGDTGASLETDGTWEYGSVVELSIVRPGDGGDGEERRHVRPDLESTAGKALCDNAMNEELINNVVDMISTDRFPVGVSGDPESGCNVSGQAPYDSILVDPQPSAVFLHSFPAPPPVTEAGLSLAEPAEPTTNVTTDCTETTGPDRGHTVLIEPGTRPGTAIDAVLGGTADRLSVPDGDLKTFNGKNSAVSEQLPGRDLRDSSPKRQLVRDTVKQDNPPGEKSSGGEPDPDGLPLSCVQDLSLGSQVRVSLDHVIDDALVVSFCLGEKVFSGVLMDVTKR